MTGGGILFGAALALLMAYWIILPFHERGAGPSGRQRGGERQQLLARKAAIYAAIREIDSDVQVGKLEPGDHRLLRQRYVAEGVEVLKALDGLQVDGSVDSEMEADIQQWRVGPQAAAKGQFCRQCGARIELGDRFCAHCGAAAGG